MIDFKSLVQKESVEDAVAFFARSPNGIGYPNLDRFYTRYRFDVISEGELLSTVIKMTDKGIIKGGESPLHYIKGPNWKEPKFVTDKKYGIE